MKKSDVVIVRDSSYSKVVTEHGLEDGYDGYDGTRVKNQRCVIIELGCRFPDPHQYQVRNNKYNNTVIKIIETGEVVFIEEEFLKPVTHRVMIDMTVHVGAITGEVIEISNKLYKEIKRDSQTK